MLGLDKCFVPFTPFARVAIMCMIGAMAKRPMVNQETGEITAKDTLLITLTADHRFLDGATAGPMIQELRAVLEDPEELERRSQALAEESQS